MIIPETLIDREPTKLRKVRITQQVNFVTVCTPDNFAIKARIARTKRMLRNNLKVKL